MNTIVFIIIFFATLYLIYKTQKREQREHFYPAWANHDIYNTLSNRLRLGVWRGWININSLQMTNHLIQLTNTEVRLFDSNDEVLEALLKNKTIDIAIVSEAAYGIYILSQLSKTTQDLTKKNVIRQKKLLEEKFNSRRLYSLYPLYRILITNNFAINKPSDISNKVIQITNISNEIYKLDLDLLKNYKYIEVYKERDRAADMYGSLKELGYTMDAYFSEYDNPNQFLGFISEKNNTNLIDLYEDLKDLKDRKDRKDRKGRNDKNTNKKDKNLFPKPEELLDKYFFLKKDKMDLSHYPSIIQRRKQSLSYNNLHYNPKFLNCYSYKILLITRSDVKDEQIYLFTKAIYDNFEYLKNNIPYFEYFDRKDLLKSQLSSILELHKATYRF
jgi:hypothetical protein